MAMQLIRPPWPQAGPFLDEDVEVDMPELSIEEDARMGNVSELQRRADASLEDVLRLLQPTVTSGDYDQSMQSFVLASEFFYSPLTRNEMIFLACGMYAERGSDAFNYADILEITDQFFGRPMNITMVYQTMKDLIARGLVDDLGKEIDKKTERAVRFLRVNDLGRSAFRMGVLNALVLRRSAA